MLAPCVAAMVFDNPIVLAGVLAAEICAGLAAGVGPELARVARLAIPLAILIALINPLVSREGLTVIAQGPVVPVLGKLDITLEAIVYGLVKGLRVVVIVLPFALLSACVDPDQVMRSLRRASIRSALTASLATRLVPTLARDAQRMSHAYRLRADVAGLEGENAGTLRRAVVLTRALAAGALERALDAAAALEVRGYGTVSRPPAQRRPWSRHDVVFGVAAAVMAAGAIFTRVVGVGAFDAYPSISIDDRRAVLAFAVLLPVLALTPFGAGRVARARYVRAGTARA
ncbi:MAG: energy-coupling factor transporter transmembrane component T [Phycisphaeraceae bacterium]